VAIFDRFFGKAGVEKSGVKVHWPQGNHANFQGGGLFAGEKGIDDLTRFSAVYACINVLSNDVAKMPIKVFRDLDNGGHERVKSHPLSRIFRKPNHYQTRMDFITQLMVSLLMRGNVYVFIDYDTRGQPSSMFVLNPDNVTPLVDSKTGDVFYSVGTEPLIPSLDDRKLNEQKLGGRFNIPARYIMHHRLMTFKNALDGISPLHAAAMSATTGLNIQSQQNTFFENQARPSGVLKTSEILDEAVIARLRAQWENLFSAQGSKFGGTAVLEQGVSWEQLTMTAVDAQLIDTLKFTVQDVASAFRVPNFLLGDLTSVTYKNAETLFRVYLSTSLSYYIESLENRINTHFDLEKDDLRVEFDTRQFLRTDFDTRMSGLKSAVQGGIYTPNEARRTEGLPDVPGGDNAFMQQQMAPVDALAEFTVQPVAAPVAALPEPEPETDLEEDIKSIDPEDVRLAVRKKMNYLHRVK
jgi:HK97 family phage portal protein